MTVPDDAKIPGAGEARRQLPVPIIDVLSAVDWNGRAASRGGARLAGFPPLWIPSNPRWWWGWAAGAATVVGICWGLASPGVGSLLFYFVLIAPGLSVMPAAWLLRVYERHRRRRVDGEEFFRLLGGQRSVDRRVAMAVRYALSRVGGFAEHDVRPDERSSTFRRLTLIRSPLLHEFSYYISERLTEVDPMALGDFLAAKPRRTVSDLIAGVQEFLQTEGDHGDE